MLAEILKSPVFTSIALAVAGAIGTLLAAAVVQLWTWIRLHVFHQLNPAEMAFVDAIAAKAVRYAFQVVDSRDGKARFDAAAEQLADQAKRRRIPLTPDQLKLWIEGAYVDFKLTVSTMPVAPDSTLPTFPRLDLRPTGAGG